MPIGPLAAATATPLASLPSLAPTAPAATSGPAGTSFGEVVTGALEDLSATQRVADELAISAATGSLPDVHDYTIAATQASLATELTVAVRNRALEAFNQIMNLPL